MIPFLQIAGGLLLLFFGGEALVRGSVGLARRLGVRPLVIGLTVVAAGTSAPEMVVSLIAGLEGQPGIAVGNVVGSNVANLLLVLGAAALVYPLRNSRATAFRDGSILIGASIVFALLALSGTIERWHGVIMVSLIVLYLIGCYHVDKRSETARRELEEEVQELEKAAKSDWIIATLLVLGGAGIGFGSDQLVDGAVTVASAAGVSPTVIGVTLVALGTSLPELAASIAAARQRHVDLAVGNVIGSCIFNLFAIMGTVSIVVPIEVPAEIVNFDLWVMLIITAAFVIASAFMPRFGRRAGALALVLYALYIVAQFAGWSGMPHHM
ncbi:MAG: calcium/sodium antiporter [Bauldia litoralis]